MRIDGTPRHRRRAGRWPAAAGAIAVSLLCLLQPAAGQEGAVTVRTPAATSEIITGRVDQALAVQLESQPGSGYAWEIARAVPGLEFLGSESEPLAGAMPGRGAVQTFRFKPVVAGEFRVDFLLRRPWEDEPVDRRIVRIRARE